MVRFPLGHFKREIAYFLASLFDPALVWKIEDGIRGQRVNLDYSAMKDFIYNHLTKIDIEQCHFIL